MVSVLLTEPAGGNRSRAVQILITVMFLSPVIVLNAQSYHTTLSEHCGEKRCHSCLHRRALLCYLALASQSARECRWFAEVESAGAWRCDFHARFE